MTAYQNFWDAEIETLLQQILKSGKQEWRNQETNVQNNSMYGNNDVT